MSVKVYYILNARMPTERAHGIQVAKMYEAMRASGMDVTVIIPRRKNAIQESGAPTMGYPDVSVVSLRVWDLYTRGRIGFLVGSSSFMVVRMVFIAKNFAVSVSWCIR